MQKKDKFKREMLENVHRNRSVFRGGFVAGIAVSTCILKHTPSKVVLTPQ